MVAAVVASPKVVMGVTDPEVCATDVLHEIDNVIGVANSITQAVVDCAPPGLNEKSCASDIVVVTAITLDIAGLAADMTMTCGALDSNCAASIATSLEVTAWLAATLMGASSDCQSDAWTCTYDVVSAIDTVNGLAGCIMNSVKLCSPTAMATAMEHPGKTMQPLLKYTDLYQTGRRQAYDGFERRLQAAKEQRVKGNTTLGRDGAFADKVAEMRLLQAKAKAELEHVRAGTPVGHGAKTLPKLSDLLALRASTPEEDVVSHAVLV